MSDEHGTSKATQDGEEISQADELIENLSPEEKKKWSEKFLELEYYKAISKTVLQIIKDFSKWAALAISGIGTMVGGWLSIQKMSRKQHLELNKESSSGKSSQVQAVRTSARPVVSLSKDRSKEKNGMASVGATQQIAETENLILEPVNNLFSDPMVITTLVSVGIFASMTLKMAFNRFFGKVKNK